MRTNFEWYEYTVLCIFAVFIVISGIARLWYFFKCIKVERCSNRECRFNKYCFRYKETLTIEEAEELERLIDSFLRHEDQEQAVDQQ